MKYRLILVLLIAPPWGLSAQNTPPQLPTAPSATKFPPKQTTQATTPETGETGTAVQSPPPATANSAPSPQTSTGTQTNITPHPGLPDEPAKSDALPATSASAKPANKADSEDNA